MEESFEKKLEIIKQRTGLQDDEARELLERCGGDVIEALLQFERSKQGGKEDSGNEKMSWGDFVEYIKGLIRCGNVSRIMIRKNEEVLVNIPVNAGIVVGLLLLLQPVLIVIGTATAVVTKLEIDIIKCDGTVEVVNKIVKSTVDSGAKAASEAGQHIMEQFEKLKEKVSRMKK